jgi:hypothetical protein
VLEGGETALLRILIEQPPGLQLHILSIGVGEEVVPDHPLPGEAPYPDLLPCLAVVGAIAYHAIVVVVPVGTRKVCVLAKNVI